MFAYVVIAIELIILYVIFWIVFIREPKPREIRAELWGRYAASEEEERANSERIELPPFIFTDQEKLNSYLPSRIKIRPYRTAKASRSRHRRSSGHSSCACLCHEKNVTTENGGWKGQPSMAARATQNKKLAERFY